MKHGKGFQFPIFAAVLGLVGPVHAAQDCATPKDDTVLKGGKYDLGDHPVYECDSLGQAQKGGKYICMEWIHQVYQEVGLEGPYLHGAKFMMRRDGQIESILQLDVNRLQDARRTDRFTSLFKPEDLKTIRKSGPKGGGLPSLKLWKVTGTKGSENPYSVGQYWALSYPGPAQEESEVDRLTRLLNLPDKPPTRQAADPRNGPYLTRQQYLEDAKLEQAVSTNSEPDLKGFKLDPEREGRLAEKVKSLVQEIRLRSGEKEKLEAELAHVETQKRERRVASRTMGYTGSPFVPEELKTKATTLRTEIEKAEKKLEALKKFVAETEEKRKLEKQSKRSLRLKGQYSYGSGGTTLHVLDAVAQLRNRLACPEVTRQTVIDSFPLIATPGADNPARSGGKAGTEGGVGGGAQ